MQTYVFPWEKVRHIGRPASYRDEAQHSGDKRDTARGPEDRDHPLVSDESAATLDITSLLTEAADLKGYRVLVLDDEPTVVALLAEVLETLGAEVLAAYSAEAACEVLNLPFDLALIDVNLPGMNGFEFLEELRRRSNVPVIMLTARTAEDDVVYGLRLGADDYVRKPFSVQELVARIERWLLRG